MARHHMARHHMAQHHMAQHHMARHHIAQHHMARHHSIHPQRRRKRRGWSVNWGSGWRSREAGFCLVPCVARP